MASRVVQIADAVKTAISDAAWASSFTVARSYADWDDVLEEMSSARIDVVPGYAPTIDLDTRGTVGGTAIVGVGVRVRFTDSDYESGQLKNSSVDPYTEVVEKVSKLLIPTRLSGLDAIGAVWQSTEIAALYMRDQLRTHRQFCGIVRVTFSTHEVL